MLELALLAESAVSSVSQCLMAVVFSNIYVLTTICYCKCAKISRTLIYCEGDSNFSDSGDE